MRTYRSRIVGKTLRWYSAQNGHWRSANSTIVTGAFGEPSEMPDCGMPFRAEPSPPLGVLVAGLLPPPAITTATSTAATATAPSTASRIPMDERVFMVPMVTTSS